MAPSSEMCKRNGLLLFANSPSFRGHPGLVQESGQDARNPEEARPKSRPLGVCIRSDNVTPVRAPTVSRFFPVCLFLPDAEAPFIPRLSHLSGDLGLLQSETPSSSRSSRLGPLPEPKLLQGRRSTRRCLSSDLSKAGLLLKVLPSAEAVGRANQVALSCWRLPVSRLVSPKR